MIMNNPSHPGEIMRITLIEDEDGNKIESVASVAERLGYTRNSLNRVINGSASLTPAMAVALERQGHGSAEFWLNLQMAHDLFHVRQGAA